jgi:hypothetical protein
MKRNTLYESIKNINDIESLLSLRDDFNAVCEKREKELQVIAESEKLNTNSFLFIKESFANLSPSLIKTKKGASIINKYVNEHKKNRELQKMFLVYENLTTANKTMNLDSFINEMKEMVGNIDTKALNRGISRLNTILKEGYVEVGEEAKNALSTHNNEVLDESVKYVFNNTKKLDNITRFNLCVNEIKNFINENKVQPISFKSKVNADEILENFNREFSADNMSEDDYKLTKLIYESENKEELFETYKNECLNKINEVIKNDPSQDTCDQLVEFRTRISKKEFNPDTIGLDIANFIELGNTISE